MTATLTAKPTTPNGNNGRYVTTAKDSWMLRAAQHSTDTLPWDYGSGGWGFESSRARQSSLKNNNLLAIDYAGSIAVFHVRIMSEKRLDPRIANPLMRST